jgi:hypothetical protein
MVMWSNPLTLCLKQCTINSIFRVTQTAVHAKTFIEE